MYNKVCINNSTRAEPKFTGKYNQPNYLQGEPGIYSCPRCANKLYKSENAFDCIRDGPLFSDTIDNKNTFKYVETYTI